MRISVDLDGVKFGDLYRFVDHARSAGIPTGAPVTVETMDGIGNEVGAHTLSVELGDVDELSRPVMIDGRDLHRYTTALSRELAQESTKDDRDVLVELLDHLYGGPDADVIPLPDRTK